MKPFLKHPGIKRLPSLLLASALVLGLVSGCDLFAPPPSGGGGTVRSLPAGFLTRKAVSYSGFRANQSPADSTYPSVSDIDADLQLLADGGFGLLRLFDASDGFTKVVLQEIADHPAWDLKVQLGAYLTPPGGANDAANTAEIARAVALANLYPDTVWAVSVGNETMVDWSIVPIPVLDMKNFITTVRSQIAQPVTTDDNWAFFANDGGGYSTDAILSVVDYVSMHSYPMADVPYADVAGSNAAWDWRQTDVAEGSARAGAMMDASLGKLQNDFGAVKAYLAAEGYSNRPIVIGETGWKAANTHGEVFLAHPMNQKMYYDRLKTWLSGADDKPAAVFWFEAFDEPWKGGDDGWGLFDVNRKARFVLHDLYGAANRLSSVYTDADAVDYKPLPATTAIAASEYSVYQDAPAVGAAVSTYTWTGWDNPWTASGSATTSDYSGDGGSMWQITPNPKAWGWGMFAYVSAHENLSNFSGGHLKLSIKTTYPGSIEVGFHTLSETSAGCDVYVQLDPTAGTYGYSNDGNWHDVSIPISALAAAASDAGLYDLSRVDSALTIADRYSYTGKTASAGYTDSLYLDNILWTQN